MQKVQKNTIRAAAIMTPVPFSGSGNGFLVMDLDRRGACAYGISELRRCSNDEFTNIALGPLDTMVPLIMMVRSLLICLYLVKWSV